MPERRHAAIMFTDIAGYTALMGRDEDAAFSMLRQNHEIHEAFIKNFKGVLVKEVGDGTLASFSLASEAVRCAINLQKACQEHKIPLKIGIHEGEMVFAGTDVLGDGVNVASRLQEASGVGSITISGKVYSEIRNQAGIDARYLGEKKLKNVEDPVKVYEVLVEGQKKNSAQDKPPGRKISFYYLIAALIVPAIAGIILWQLFRPEKINRANPVMEKSIAVIPFVNLSNDPDQEYFVDGMVDEILDHLFKVRELRVISRTSSMRFKNTSLSLKEIGEELGVASILEGSVRKVGNTVRITVQLIDASTDTHLWSETYDGDLSDIFSIQSEVARKVAAGLRITLTQKENDLIHKKIPTASNLAYDFYLKGIDYWAQYNAPMALEMYSKAIAEDSLFAAAYARRAFMHLHYGWLKIEDWPGHDTLARDDIRKAYQLDPGSIEAKISEATFYYMVDRNYDKATKLLNELKKDAPNMAELYAYVSYNLRRQGRWDESIRELKQAIDMDPLNANYIGNLLGSYGIMHEYKTQIKEAKKGLSMIPDYTRFRDFIFDAVVNDTGDLNKALKESGLKKDEVLPDIYYYTRQYDSLIDYTNEKFTFVSSQSSYRPKSYWLALYHYLNGNTVQSKICADSAIVPLRKKIREIPGDSRFYATMGYCYAIAGNVAEAHSFGKKAIEMLPISLDAYQGPYLEHDLMQIYILTGHYDLALDKIEFLLSIPSWLSTGELMIDPIYDPLRNLSRFREILEAYINPGKKNPRATNS